MIRYTGLNRQFINGNWTDGRAEVMLGNLNPFTEEVIHSLPSAATNDVDTAFQAAQNASAARAGTNPLFRRDLLLKAARLISERQEEFID
ncbi:aldehyde dehydrogenase family protein [Fibrella sp. HMF5036]|uniref:Aldehyde dehydrogenase family protein n=1 Tax=Fibrella aquatilis TaxID=2817059 RepID=A0A939JY85_9BACT|nr:aldehyde dehydrogenase family protein [Fibrella aquatilis]